MPKITQRSKELEMSESLTLNKITAQKGISIAEAANRVADLGWTPSYVQEAMTFPTDYKISKTPRDPMKQVLRSYFPMQEEKDNRVYGALDAALRGDMFRNVEPRWVEWMKLFLAIIPFPEISAARSMAMVGRLAPGEELRTGFTMQMVDEFRHSTIQMNLKKWYMENYIDPAGFDITEAAFGKCYATTIGRQFAEGFLTGDAVTAANVFLQVVAETAFTLRLAPVVERSLALPRLERRCLVDARGLQHARAIRADRRHEHVVPDAIPEHARRRFHERGIVRPHIDRDVELAVRQCGEILIARL